MSKPLPSGAIPMVYVLVLGIVIPIKTEGCFVLISY